MTVSDFSVSLEGKVAVVTGAKGGIGKAIAFSIAKAGADIAITDIFSGYEELEAIAAEIRDFGVRCLAVPADITQKNDIDQLVGQVLNEFGAIDLLINVAGVYQSAPLLEFQEVDWDRVMDVNLKGFYLSCQVIGRCMVEQKFGNIINIASDSAIDVAEGDGPYACSKAGVVVLTKHLARELGQYNIRVNGIAPGWVKTERTKFVWGDPVMLKNAESQVPLGFMAEPDDISNVALFLTSSASRYLSGHVVVANGGRV